MSLPGLNGIMNRIYIYSQEGRASMEEEKEIYKADDRLIVALDVDSFDSMKALVDELGDLVSYYKVGMELYYSAGSATIHYLKEHGKKVFLDLKLHDIPNTVGHSVASVTRLGVNLITVHAGGGRAMMQAAAEIGGHLPIQDHVLELASLAKEAGVDGVVASPKEATSIREMAGDDFLIVTPGIRPAFAQTDDQKRIATPSQAFKDGASMLAATRLILKEIKENA